MDFVKVGDLGADGIRHLVDLAAEVKRDRDRVAGTRRGLRVGLFFEKPSTRTRVSCEVATTDLGSVPIVLKQDEVGLGSREAVEDVARVLDRYLDVLAFRVFDHRNLDTIAAHAAAPVINLLSDLEHPCQALADMQTIAENLPVQGSTIAYVGDGNNVCTSLMIAGAALGARVRVASPSGYEPPAWSVEEAGAVAANGGQVEVMTDPAEAVRGADAVYTDVWTSMGQEAEAAERRSLFAPYRVDEALFGLAAPTAIFLHCLPAHREEEVTDGVVDHERSRVFDQAENRLHAFKALLLHLTG
ncbi:MAG TPA: ornithine carbamoyltransferase [Acidimicrobiia bacterium]|nr:ornithine carbamoyltransferase [Acidimicrobiia bacterium]